MGIKDVNGHHHIILHSTQGKNCVEHEKIFYVKKIPNRFCKHSTFVRIIFLIQYKKLFPQKLFVFKTEIRKFRENSEKNI
jgi:hypothetical protein